MKKSLYLWIVFLAAYISLAGCAKKEMADVPKESEYVTEETEKGENEESQESEENATAGIPVVPVKKNGKWGYLDQNGKTAIEARYDDACLFNNETGMALIAVNDKYGWINREGEVVIQPQYDCAGDFSEGLARVGFRQNVKDHLWRYGYIDTEGNVVIEIEYDEASNFKDGLALVETEMANGTEQKFINRYGETVLEHFCERKNGADWKGGFSYNRALVDEPIDMGEYELAHSRYGFMNARGEMVIECQYNNASEFSDGLAAVCVADGWGYIDTDGEFVIKPQYAYASDFTEGYAIVGYDDKSYLIDRYGKIILEDDGTYSLIDLEHTDYGRIYDSHIVNGKVIAYDRTKEKAYIMDMEGEKLLEVEQEENTCGIGMYKSGIDRDVVISVSEYTDEYLAGGEYEVDQKLLAYMDASGTVRWKYTDLK